MLTGNIQGTVVCLFWEDFTLVCSLAISRHCSNRWRVLDWGDATTGSFAASSFRMYQDPSDPQVDGIRSACLALSDLTSAGALSIMLEKKVSWMQLPDKVGVQIKALFGVSCRHPPHEVGLTQFCKQCALRHAFMRCLLSSNQNNSFLSLPLFFPPLSE